MALGRERPSGRRPTTTRPTRTTSPTAPAISSAGGALANADSTKARKRPSHTQSTLSYSLHFSLLLGLLFIVHVQYIQYLSYTSDIESSVDS